MDDELRNGLWNCIFELFSELPGYDTFSRSLQYAVIRAVWRDVKHGRVDELFLTDYKAVGQFKAYFLNAKWDEAYEILEGIAGHLGAAGTSSAFKPWFVEKCNEEMTRHAGGYRFVSDELSPITSQDEIAEIEGAVAESSDPVAEHLRTALAFLSDRENPNYRNSIKESLSAVEAAVGELTNAGLTLGKGLDMLKLDIHPALRGAYSKIYGYSSDEGGIRHSLSDESREVMQEEARYMLISCSAFINYLKAVKARSG